jgi:hypothetical protein
MKISVVGKGAEWKKAPSPTALNELNYALPWLIMGQILKTYGYAYFLSKPEGTV